MITFFPFRYKLTLLVSIIVVLLLMAVFAVVQSTIEREFRFVIQNQLQQAELVAQDQMQQRFDALLSEAFFLQGNQLVRFILKNKQYDESTRNDILTDEVFPNLVYSDFVIVFDAEAEIKAITTEATSCADKIQISPHIEESMLGEDKAGYVLTHEGFRQFISLPIFLSDTLIGIVVVGKSLAVEDLNHVKSISDIDLGVVNDKQIVFHTDWRHRLDHSVQEITEGLNRTLLEETALLSGTIHEVNIDNERFLTRYVNDDKSFMPPHLLVQSLDYKLVFVQTIRNHLVFVLIVAILGSVMVALIFSNGISRPILALKKATAEIEQENFEHRVVINTSDEFSQLAASFNQMIHELKEKQKVRDALNKSVSSDVAQHILNTGVKLGGERCDASILFLDIRGFTSLSERLNEKELITLLNRYFTDTAQPIHEYHGTIDKFIGDAIMVLFGIPKDDPVHAFHSIKAAMGIMHTLEKFNASHGKKLGVSIEIGIGINSGAVVAGMVGAEERLNYTALGDNVNLASRIEGLTKSYGVHIIITGNTYDKLSDEQKDQLYFRRLDCVRVKGKEASCHIYEVILSLPDESYVGAITAYEEGLDKLRTGKLKEACTTFKQLHEAWPEDTAIKVMLERVELFLKDDALYCRCYVDGSYIHRSK